MTADALLSRLENVRSRGKGQWSARCPAHDDKGPSLSVKETDDGVMLLKCFAGCEAADVVGAVGLDLSDLFPPRPTQTRPGRTRLLPASQALEVLEFEAMLVAVAAGNVARGVVLTPDDLARVQQAAGRIAAIRQEALA